MPQVFFTVNSITIPSSFNRHTRPSPTPIKIHPSPPSTLTSSSSPSVISRISTRSRHGGSASLTLEKPKLDLSHTPISESPPEIAVGGGGGGVGKKIIHGGGGGDGGNGGGGDDDDFFEDFEEGDDGDDIKFFRKIALQEVFDRRFVDAVLQEWHKTALDLPAGLRQAYEMGLVSSAQMVRFLVVHARPTFARFVSRVLPGGFSRGFNGRMVADPGFLLKFSVDTVSTIGCTMLWELRNRRGRMEKEWDLALANVVASSLGGAVVAWSLAPCRSYGDAFRFGFENALQKLPNNVFERSYLLREFGVRKRVQSFFYRAAQFCVVGVVSGAVRFYSSKMSRSRRGERAVDPIPSVGTCCLAYGALIGVYANMRYQVLCGVDRALMDHLNDVRVGLFVNTALRIFNVHVGEISRSAWIGPELTGLSKESIVSSINIFKRNSTSNGESNIPRPRRKIIRKRRVAVEHMAPC